MDHLERLIRRALAAARSPDAGAFDPFEQVAPWVVEPAAVAVPAATNNGDARQATPPTLAERAQPAMPPAATIALAQATAPAQHLPAALSDDIAAASAAAPAVEAVRAPGPRIEAAPAAPAPQARADAFMQTLGVPPARRDAAEPPAPSPSATVEPPSSQAAVIAPTARARPSEPALLRPLPPRTALVPGTAVSSARRPDSAATAPSATPPPPARPKPSSAPQRIVQTTVVVAPPARRLDELAHSSAISRFGIGQG